MDCHKINISLTLTSQDSHKGSKLYDALRMLAEIGEVKLEEVRNLTSVTPNNAITVASRYSQQTAVTAASRVLPDVPTHARGNSVPSPKSLSSHVSTLDAHHTPRLVPCSVRSQSAPTANEHALMMKRYNQCINPISGRSISIDGPTFNKLLRKGYNYDPTTNTLSR